jgi:CubicO group peptidase (beta-lactamase class C family)
MFNGTPGVLRSKAFSRLMPAIRVTFVFLLVSAPVVTSHPAPGLAAQEVAADRTQAAPTLQRPAPPALLTSAMLADVEAYATSALGRFGVPGAAVAIVQGGQMVYSQGFGVAELGGSQAVNADTRFLIGSVGKGMTAQMIGGLVDEGLLTWDTRVVDVLPRFALEDPASTETVTFRDLLSMRSGLPRYDVPLFFTALTAEDVIEQVAHAPLLGPPGEAFGYSNQGYSVAGFAAAAAAVGNDGRDLSEVYVELMQGRFFEPAGMSRVTMDFDTGANDPNRASSHAVDAHGELTTLHLNQERFASPILPAGGATWATVEDLAAYLALQMRHGVGPNGARIASEAAVVETWKPHTPMGGDASFGLGWITAEPFHEFSHLTYGGGNLGYSSLVSFLPDANLGIAVLANTPFGDPFLGAMSEYVYELAFGLAHDADARRVTQTRENDTMMAELASLVGEIGDPTSLIPYTGDYRDARVGFDDQGRFVLSNAFGDLLLLPLVGMDRTFVIDGLLGGVVEFNVTPDGGRSLTVSRPLGDPQPGVTLVRVE